MTSCFFGDARKKEFFFFFDARRTQSDGIENRLGRFRSVREINGVPSGAGAAARGGEGAGAGGLRAPGTVR